MQAISSGDPFCKWVRDESDTRNCVVSSESIPVPARSSVVFAGTRAFPIPRRETDGANVLTHEVTLPHALSFVFRNRVTVLQSSEGTEQSSPQ